MWKKRLFISCLRVLTIIGTLALGQVAVAYSVILDAGHGGKDYGAKGVKAYEKDINLAVAKQIADYIDKNYDDVNVLLTRDDDTYLTLKERADFANKNGGDIFVSVHVNSVDKKNRNRANIQGASVYTLGLHKSEANFEVAKRENAVMSLENDYTATYSGFDPESTESYIIFEMGQNKHMNQSIALAQLIQNGLTGKAGRDDRGVRQAGFWVLWATGMPSVLIELDFICNPTQEKFLTSKAGQKKMASAIGEAIGKYVQSHSTLEAPEIYDSITGSSDIPTNSSKTSKDSSATTWHVQILASSKQIKGNSSEFKGYKTGEFKEGKWHKYYVGTYSSAQEAKQQLDKLKKDFPDAFVIAMRNGKRVTK